MFAYITTFPALAGGIGSYANVSAPLACRLPQGGFVAAAAAELRWERLAALCALAVLSWHCAYEGSPRALLLTSLYLGLLDICGNELRSTLGEQVSLWGAPVHMSSALLCVALCSLLAVLQLRKQPLGVALVGSTLLLLLGLAWNFLENGGNKSWTWDWIEAGPPLCAGGLVACSHAWARRHCEYGVVVYIAFLQISRAALLASAHHLQPPLSLHVWDQLLNLQILEGRLSAAPGLLGALVFLWLSRGASLAFPVAGGWGLTAAQPRAAAPWSLHMTVAGAWVLALVPGWSQGAAALGWLWFGWAGRWRRLSLGFKCLSSGAGLT